MKTFIQFLESLNKIKLWLDDLRNPNDPTIQKKFNAPSDAIWVKTIEEAILYLKQGNVEFISFDNDLGEENGKLLKSGYDLAKWIEEAAFNNEIPFLQWQVHSANPIGVKNITQAMNNANNYWNINI